MAGLSYEQSSHLLETVRTEDGKCNATSVKFHIGPRGSEGKSYTARSTMSLNLCMRAELRIRLRKLWGALPPKLTTEVHSAC